MDGAIFQPVADGDRVVAGIEDEQGDPVILFAQAGHGPYWHFTARVEGKTVNKRLSERDARLYREWIGNDRTVRALLTEMREVAAKAQAIIRAERATDRPRLRATSLFT